MVAGATGRQACHMTESPSPKKLTRSGSDSLIGGVAGGLGRYFSVDPILFRIAFVVLSFVGGVGVIAYLGLLAFVPSDGEGQPGGTSRVAAVAGAVVLGLALVTFLGTPLFFFGPGLLVVAVVGVAGLLLWRAVGGDTGGGDPARTAARLAIAAAVGIAVAGAAVGVALAAALGGGVVIAALAVVAGLALIATAFVGGPRWLIVPALALVLPLGVVAAADLDFRGGIGDYHYRPASVADLEDRYEVGMGEIEVDLRGLDLPAGRTELGLDVGLGHAIVHVPEDVCVTSDFKAGIGGIDLLNREHAGVDVAFAESGAPQAGRPAVHIDADVGIGVVEVVREGSYPDAWRSGRWERGFDGVAQDTGCA